MNTLTENSLNDTDAYARCVGASKQVRWDIDQDVLRGRTFDLSQKFLPDSITFLDRLAFINEAEHRFLSQIQGRTYANMFGLVERFINCKVLELSKDHWTGDQVALEALVRFSDEELKHQELFRRVERMIAAEMPEGYRFLPRPNEVAEAVLSASTWAVLALTLHIELFTQAHYRKSVEPDANLSPLFKDILFFHWKEESQHARIDELELKRDHRKLSPEAIDSSVDDLISLVGAVKTIIDAQAEADTAYFLNVSGVSLYEENRESLFATIRAAYHWQYIDSAVQETRFPKILGALLRPEQMNRITSALEAIRP